MYCKNKDLPPAMMFKNRDCEDRVIRVVPDSADGPTRMNYDKVQREGLSQDEVSSVMVPFGWTLTLFDNDG